jgi:UDP-N-acetylmuramate--alanine ligase
MGIGGQGISAVAQMVLEAERENVIVTGCDMQASATTRALEHIGVPVQIGHCADHLADIDRLIVVPAALVLNPDHPELVMARARGIPMITWQEMLGELMHKKCVLSVSGVHGKGTTTALLSLILVDAGLDPTCEVGAVVPRFGFNYRLGKSRYFVNEADEFYNNFWHYHPRVAVITSIEFEHPEFFADYAEFLASFEHFVRGMDIEGDWPVPSTLIVNADSPGCFELLARLHDWPGRVVTYRVIQKEPGARSTDNKQAIVDETRLAGSKTGKAVTNAESISSNAAHSLTFEAYDVELEGETSFRVRIRGSSEQELPTLAEDISIRLQLSGVHNVQNALAAFTAASILGIDTHTIIQTLEGFTGIRRRFEIRQSQSRSTGKRSTLSSLMTTRTILRPSPPLWKLRIDGIPLDVS